MEPNTAGPVIVYPARSEAGTRGCKELVLGSLSSPAPGRILNQGYLLLAGILETRANRVAHRWGLGPDFVASKISSSFGIGEERASNLSALRNKVPPELEKNCSKLMKYTLPCASSMLSTG